MKKIKLVAIFFFLATTLFAQSKQILLLQSYNKGLKWSDDISLGLEDQLKKYKNYELTTEYMDGKKNYSKLYQETVYRLFLQKLQFNSYDVIIVADNYAINFCKKYHKQLFKNSKIIFIGLDKDFPGVNIKKILGMGIPIVLENKQVHTNIVFLTSFLKHLKSLYIINDTSLSSLLINKKFQDVANMLNKKVPTRLNLDGNIDEISKEISSLPKNSAVLFGSLFVDRTGNYLPYYKVNKMLNNSKFPVFSLTDSHLGRGVIGGLLSTGYEQGEEAGKLALKYLNNLEVDTSKPILAKAKWIFDYNILKKYNLLNRSLPKDAVVINEPKNFFEKYKKIINIAFILFPIIFIILILFIFIIIKKNKLDRKLLEQKYLTQKQLDNIKDLICWIDKEGFILGCNNAFCNFMNIKREKILDKNIKNINKKFNNSLSVEKLFSVDFFEFNYNDKIYYVKTNFINYQDQKTNFLTISDITQLKRAELDRQFFIQQSKLTEIGEMLSSLSHQWKTPLVELSAVAHKMHHYNKMKKLSNENIENFFNIIMEQIIFMSDTVDGIRTFVKPSTKLIKFDIDMGIKEILSITSKTLQYNYICIEYTNFLNKEIFINGYPNEFKQVLLNIINNAKDSILEDRSKNSTQGKITIHLNQISESVKIVIQDNGIGFNKELEQEVFKPYFTTKKDGVGIGLHMARIIIENKMKGKLRAYSLEKGVKFVITLPKVEDEGFSTRR